MSDIEKDTLSGVEEGPAERSNQHPWRVDAPPGMDENGGAARDVGSTVVRASLRISMARGPAGTLDCGYEHGSQTR